MADKTMAVLDDSSVFFLGCLVFLLDRDSLELPLIAALETLLITSVRVFVNIYITPTSRTLLEVPHVDTPL
jgi:hypothetical protein